MKVKVEISKKLKYIIEYRAQTESASFKSAINDYDYKSAFNLGIKHSGFMHRQNFC